MQTDYKLAKAWAMGSIFWFKLFLSDFAEKDAILERLEQRLSQLAPGVTLMVTHQVVIISVTGQAVGSGELFAYNTRSKDARKFRLD